MCDGKLDLTNLQLLFSRTPSKPNEAPQLQRAQSCNSQFKLIQKFKYNSDLSKSGI